MKTVNVKIGETYLCKVGDRLVKVVVIARCTGEMHASGRMGVDTFRVKRVDSATVLPKTRTAAALRPIPVSPLQGYDSSGNAIRSTTPVIGAVQVSSLEELETLDDPALPHEPAIPDIPPTERNLFLPTIVSQEFYLSAAENHVGWCVRCQAFRGNDLEPDSRECECPECHEHTLYGAELALSAGLIEPQEEDNV